MTKHAPPVGFALYACLPFIELAHENVVELGPVLFWPASRADDFLEDPLCRSFYFASIIFAAQRQLWLQVRALSFRKL